MTGTRRAELRQVGFAALDYAAAVRAATELLKATVMNTGQ